VTEDKKGRSELRHIFGAWRATGYALSRQRQLETHALERFHHQDDP
jgi:hypothetical protein